MADPTNEGYNAGFGGKPISSVPTNYSGAEKAEWTSGWKIGSADRGARKQHLSGKQNSKPYQNGRQKAQNAIQGKMNNATGPVVHTSPNKIFQVEDRGKFVVVHIPTSREKAEFGYLAMAKNYADNFDRNITDGKVSL
jgi:ribosome modulation factor